MRMIEIDGSHLEGGGQLLRTTLAFSALTGKPFAIRNIRGGRPNPGLRSQHLNAVRAAQAFCGAEVSGLAIGSRTLSFVPAVLAPRDVALDVGTAGSVTLLAQSVLLPAVFGGREVSLDLTGGTDVTWSQPVDYFRQVLLPFLERFAEVEAVVDRRGYYPKGGGRLKLTFRPRFALPSYDEFGAFQDHVRNRLPAMDLTRRGELLGVEGVSHAADTLKGVAERQAQQASWVLEEHGYSASIRVEYSRSICPGSGITLWASFSGDPWPVVLGSDALGRRGKRAEVVGEEAARTLLAEMESGACVDRHLADQLLPFLVFLPSASYRTSEVTLHCRTNMHVIQQFVDVAFSVSGNMVSVMRQG